MTEPGIVSPVCRGCPDFSVSLPDKAGKASESVTLFSDRSAQTTSCVLLSTARCNFRQIRRRSLPCFLTFHSPSPKTFSPVESITGVRFHPGERFETDINRLCPLTDTGVIRAAQRNVHQGKMESIKPCAARRVSRNTRLITRTVVMARSE